MRGLVAVYYVALRAVLRNKPHLRRYLARCRHCWIFFITDPRNAGRKDLGCPFGCAHLHRSKKSNERSTEYNRSGRGKLKRMQREEEQRLAEDASASDGSSLPEEVHLATTARETPGPVYGGVESPQAERVDPPCASPEVSLPATDHASSSDAAACGASSHSSGDRVAPSRGESDPSPSEAEPSAAGGSGPAEPGRVQIAPHMVVYIGTVVSLIEGRRVDSAEVVAMLERTWRQHSLAREGRTEYVLRRLMEEPEKPP